MNRQVVRFINMILCAALVITAVIVAIAADARETSGEVSYAQAASGSVLLSEIMPQNKSAVPCPDGGFYDYVELYNPTSSPVSLSGLALSDDEAKPNKYPLPDVTIPAGGYHVIYCSGLSAAGHTSFKLSDGETVTLSFAADGVVYDSKLITGVQTNQALIRDSSGIWSVSDEYSPGMANMTANHEAYLKQFDAVGTGDIVINEVISLNASSYKMPDGTAPDWIELYNKGQTSVDLGSWSLSDDANDPFEFVFERGTVIEPGGYLLVLCTKVNNPQADPPQAAFGVSGSGETITLYNPQRKSVDRVDVPMLKDDVSYGRAPDGSDAWREMPQPTPGLPNDERGVTAMLRQLTEANPGIFITEAQSVNDGTLETGGITPDWLEVANLSGGDMDMTGWAIAESAKGVGAWSFPDGYLLKNGESVIVYASEELAADGGDFFCADFNISSAGDAIVLLDSNKELVDKIVVPAMTADLSYGRDYADPALFYLYDQPTPGEKNAASGYLGLAAVPYPDSAPGIYNGVSGVSVSFEAEPGVTLHYTTDGTAPTSSSAKYGAALSLSKTTALRVVAKRDGYMDSEVATFSYIVNENHTLPIVSLTTDPKNLFDHNTGILAPGPEGSYTTADGYHTKANWWKEWERPVHIEYLTEAGRELAQDAGIKIQGATSRDQAQKSFHIVARNDYGDNRFSFNPFPARDFTEYKNLVLRNTGQDYYRARMRDALLSSLMEGTGVYYQDNVPVIVYINGEYYGQYYLRERVNEHSIAQHEGITDPDAARQIDMLSGSGKSASQIVNGSTKRYQELVNYIKDHDLRKQEYLNYVLTQVDVNNLFDYFAFQIIIGNSDPSNIKFYNANTEGSKWKWVIYDVDWAFNTGDNGAGYNSFDRMLKSSGIGRNNTDNTIMLGLLKNKDMEKLFLERFAGIYNENFAADRVHAKIDEFRDILRPEMERQFALWGPKEKYNRDAERWENEVALLHRYIDEARPNLLKYCKSWFGLSDSEMRGLFGSAYGG